MIQVQILVNIYDKTHSTRAEADCKITWHFKMSVPSYMDSDTSTRTLLIYLPGIYILCVFYVIYCQL